MSMQDPKAVKKSVAEQLVSIIFHGEIDSHPPSGSQIVETVVVNKTAASFTRLRKIYCRSRNIRFFNMLLMSIKKDMG